MASDLAPPSILSFPAPVKTITLHDNEGAAFTVRPFEVEDRVELERFYREFEPKRGAQGLPPASTSRIREWLDSVLSGGIHLVVERGALLGHAFVVPTRREGVGEYAVFLREDFRGRGLGTELNRAVVDAARSANLERLWLTVEPRNRAAVRSYEKAGFRFLPETLYSIEPEMELPLR